MNSYTIKISEKAYENLTRLAEENNTSIVNIISKSLTLYSYVYDANKRNLKLCLLDSNDEIDTEIVGIKEYNDEMDRILELNRKAGKRSLKEFWDNILQSVK